MVNPYDITTVTGPSPTTYTTTVGPPELLDELLDSPTMDTLPKSEVFKTPPTTYTTTPGTIRTPLGLLDELLDSLTMDTLSNSAVFRTPIETLVDLWEARFGDVWVADTELNKDQFFSWASLRLKRAGKLECYFVKNDSNNGSHTAMRIIK